MQPQLPVCYICQGHMGQMIEIAIWSNKSIKQKRNYEINGNANKFKFPKGVSLVLMV